MAVPAHDERDREFAERYDLPIRPVIDEEAGVMVDSGEFSGLPVDEGLEKIVEWPASRAAARRRSATACATGRSRASATGAARSRSSTARTTGSFCPRISCRELPEVEDYRPRQAAAGVQRGVDQRPMPEVRQAREARGGHDGHVRRLVLVLPALLRPAQRPGADRGSSTSGCRSTSTSAASITRPGTCSTRASSSRR